MALMSPELFYAIMAMGCADYESKSHSERPRAIIEIHECPLLPMCFVTANKHSENDTYDPRKAITTRAALQGVGTPDTLIQTAKSLPGRRHGRHLSHCHADGIGRAYPHTVLWTLSTQTFQISFQDVQPVMIHRRALRKLVALPQIPGL